MHKICKKERYTILLLRGYHPREPLIKSDGADCAPDFIRGFLQGYNLLGVEKMTLKIKDLCKSYGEKQVRPFALFPDAIRFAPGTFRLKHEK